ARRPLGATDPETARLHADLARDKHAAGVAVPAVEDRGDVDIDDVARLQALVGGNAVTDHVVDRGADRLRVTAIAERRGDRLVVEDVVVAELVELSRAD